MLYLLNASNTTKMCFKSLFKIHDQQPGTHVFLLCLPCLLLTNQATLLTFPTLIGYKKKVSRVCIEGDDACDRPQLSCAAFRCFVEQCSLFSINLRNYFNMTHRLVTPCLLAAFKQLCFVFSTTVADAVVPFLHVLCSLSCFE